MGQIVLDDDCANDDTTDWTQIDAWAQFDTDHYVLQVGVDGEERSTCYMYQSNLLIVGVRYKITLDYYIPSPPTNTKVDTLSIRHYYDSAYKMEDLGTLNVQDSWTSVTGYCDTQDILRDMFIVYMQDGDSSDNLTVGDEIWVKNILVESTQTAIGAKFKMKGIF